MKRGRKNLFKRKEKKMNCCTPNSCGGGLYLLGFIGSLVYYIQVATSFLGGVLGILKAFVWPAILIYKLLGFLYGI